MAKSSGGRLVVKTWVVGDIHGCAEELAELLEQIQLGPEDRFISVGDLYHRGPDPVGVLDILNALPHFDLVLGNHERVMLERFGLAGELADGTDATSVPEDLVVSTEQELAGDGGTPMKNVDPSRGADLIRILENRAYFLRGTHAGQDWLIVHAGVLPGVPVEETSPFALSRLRRLEGLPGSPYWYEAWNGPELFGHTPATLPRTRFQGERLVALGLDTGCVYGGCLTAYCLEDESMARVDAKGSWA
jgi:serine/threonine protein phosphatase 1